MFTATHDYDSPQLGVGKGAEDVFSYTVRCQPSDLPATVQAGDTDNQDYALFQAWLNAQIASVLLPGSTFYFPVESPGTTGNILYQAKYTNRLGPYAYRLELRYRAPTAERLTGDSSLSFTTGGGTYKMMASRQTIAAVAGPNQPAASISDYGGAINVSGDATDLSAEGVDVILPQLNFRTTFYTPFATISQNYVQNLLALTSRVNSDNVTFSIRGVTMSFPPGSLRFNEAEGSERKDYNDWEFTLSWSSIPNETNFTLGGITYSGTKNGWDYAWVLYKKTALSQTIGLQAVAMYIDRVYDYQPLSPLIPPDFIGTMPWVTSAR